MLKEDIRKVYKQKRRRLTAAEKNKLEDLMLIQFQQLDIFSNFSIMTYAPIDVQNEYNPYLAEKYFLFKNENATFIYPKIFKRTDEMIGYIVGEDTIFVQNEYGIDEPEGLCIPIKPIDIQVMFVPIIAFDNDGHRVGYGKGYYDKFISKCDPELIIVGFSFFDPIEIDDINKYDQKMTYCITPTKLYKF